MIDAQFELMRVLRPAANFETINQGQAGTRPIAFPGTLDDQAGKTGYSSALGAGIAMPSKGAHVKIWIPQIIDFSGETLSPSYDYVYQLNWRLRSLPEYTDDAKERSPQPTPFSLPGRQQGFVSSGSPRWFMPGGADTILFEQTEPSGAGTEGDPGMVNMRIQRYRPMVDPQALPLGPTGSTMIWQQGVYENAGTSVAGTGPSYAVFDVEAQGDELSIWVFKFDTDVAWDFAGVDEQFSYTYGTNNGSRAINPNVGILVTVGASSS